MPCHRLCGARRTPRAVPEFCAPGTPHARHRCCSRTIRRGAAHIAAWCQAPSPQADARLLVVLPGGAGERERLAARIRQALDAAAILTARRARHAAGGALKAANRSRSSRSAPRPSRPCVPGRRRHWNWNLWVRGCAHRSGRIRRTPARRTGAAGEGTHWRRRTARSSGRAAPGAESKPAARELTTLLRRAAGALRESSATRDLVGALRRLPAPSAGRGVGALQPRRRRPATLARAARGVRGALAEHGSLQRRAALGLLRALARRTAYRPADEDVAVTVSPMLADPVDALRRHLGGGPDRRHSPQPLAPDPFLPLAAQLAAGVPQRAPPGAAPRPHGPHRLARRDERSRAVCPQRARATWSCCRARSLARPFSAGAPRTRVAAGAPGTARSNRVAPMSADRCNLATPPRVARGPSSCRTPARSSPMRSCVWGACGREAAEPGFAARSARAPAARGTRAAVARPRGLAPPCGAISEALQRAHRRRVGGRADAAHGSARHRRRARRRRLGSSISSARCPRRWRANAGAPRRSSRACASSSARRAPFTVEATEEMAELSLGGGRVRLRLDRIDRIAQGRVVLDYKSGRPSNPDWYGERPTHPQLLAYLASLGADVVALATVNVTAREVRFAASPHTPTSAARCGQLAAHAAPAWSAQRERWEGLLAGLISALPGRRRTGRPGPRGLRLLPPGRDCAASARIRRRRPPPPRTRPMSEASLEADAAARAAGHRARALGAAAGAGGLGQDRGADAAVPAAAVHGRGAG